LDERIASAPDDAMLYLRRGDLHRIHQDWDACRADLERARKLDPRLAEVDLRLGMMLLDAGEPKAAAGALDAFLRERPDSATGRMTRARVHAELGEWLAAAEQFDRTLDASPPGHSSPTIYLERAMALAAAGPDHVAEAIRGLDEGIAELSQPVTLELLAIDYEVRLARYDDALARLDEIAARSQRRESWDLRRAEILESAGRTGDAREAYASTLEAIDSLGVGRRANRAVKRMAAAAREGLERLDAETVEDGS
jgi:predicted Zn-dependent protease